VLTQRIYSAILVVAVVVLVDVVVHKMAVSHRTWVLSQAVRRVSE